MKKVHFVLTLYISLLCLLLPTSTAQSKGTSAMVHSKHYMNNELIIYPELYSIDAAPAKAINSVMLDAAKKSYAQYIEVKAAEKKLSKAELCKQTVRCRYSFNSLYRVMYNKKGKISIYYSEYTYTGGKKGTSKVTMYNFSTTTGQRYVLSDILKSKNNYQRVGDYAFTYMHTHKPYAASVKKRSAVKVNGKSRFIFGDGGFYLFFTNYKGYEPSAYDDGDPYIKIPSRVYK